ncbi:MAG: exosortase/archaeosortase family protein, partial [Chloroflexi bacterium]|nr:exosortase/archaeosortase family protein [Chloroflexota bacterium]
QDLTYDLQQISYDSSRWIADVVGVQTTGNAGGVGDPQIIVGDPLNPAARLAIAPACSGINTLVAILSLAALYSFILNGRLYRRALVLGLSFPVAILANSLRLATIIVRADNRGQDSAMTLHDWADPMFFIIALLILVLISMILGLSVRTRANTGERRRHILLSLWLGIMIVAYAIAALFSVGGSSVLAESLHDAPSWALWFLSMATIAGMVCVAAVFMWKRWGFYGLCTSGVAILAVSLISGASIAAALSGIIAAAILYGLLHLGKERKAWAQLR